MTRLLLESFGIDYEILEANSRIGGRIHIYRFDEERSWWRLLDLEPQSQASETSLGLAVVL